MIPLLEELKTLMERHGLSPAEISKYVGVSEGTAYNWLVYARSSPRPVYYNRIRQAMRKIRREFEGQSIGLEINKYYLAVWPKLTRKEKDEILSLLSEPGATFRPAYLEKLKALAAAHRVKVDDPGENGGDR